jgi:predicted MPP superfamily phosphohydrolase
MEWREANRRRRREAERLFANPALGLEPLARTQWRSGFAGGAEWMRAALGAIRDGSVPSGRASFQRLGCAKYGACLAAAALVVTLGGVTDANVGSTALAATLAFYVVEVQFVFLFPAALDRSRPAWAGAWRLMRETAGTVRALATVLPIAARMLTGGLRGWCCGCLEVLLWYEEARTFCGPRTNSLVLGDGGPVTVRSERIPVVGLSRSVRIAWISDLHLGRRSAQRTVRRVVVASRTLHPDAIVLGGDLVDGERGLRQLAGLVRALRRIAPVWALPGNHDEWFDRGRVAATVRGAGGGWLPGVAATVADTAVTLVTSETTRVSGIVVACLHAPSAARQWRGRARLLLAGHLHGGQVVLAKHFGRDWPGAFFFRWCGPRFELSEDSTLLVSRGVGDTLPIRWRCPREVICADLVPAA